MLGVFEVLDQIGSSIFLVIAAMESVISVELDQIHAVQELSESDFQQWLDEYPTLDAWLPGHLEPSLDLRIKEFTWWLDIMWTEEDGMFVDRSGAGNVRPCMRWLWMSSEHLTIDETHELVIDAARAFHDRVGWCCVYSPEEHDRVAKVVLAAFEIFSKDISGPRAMRKLESFLDAREGHSAESPHD